MPESPPNRTGALSFHPERLFLSTDLAGAGLVYLETIAGLSPKSNVDPEEKGRGS